MADNKVLVDADALRDLLNAVVSAPHRVAELVTIANTAAKFRKSGLNMPNDYDPVGKLIADLNVAERQQNT